MEHVSDPVGEVARLGSSANLWVNTLLNKIWTGAWGSGSKKSFLKIFIGRKCEYVYIKI